jgi:hypothetical protein
MTQPPTSPSTAEDKLQARSLRQAQPIRGRITDIHDQLRSHRMFLCMTLSLIVGIIALVEPLLLHPISESGWLLPSTLLSAACIINAVLTQGKYAQVTTHVLVLLLAGFATIQIIHHTGISWAFALPPLVLFLHPLRQGLTYLLGGVLILTTGFMLAVRYRVIIFHNGYGV